MRTASFLVALTLCAISSPAAAYEEQVAVGVDLGYSQIIAPTSTIARSGPTLGVNFSFGLNDAFSFSGRIGYAVHPGSPTAHLLPMHFEIVYLLDILQIVPFFGLGLNGVLAFENRAVGLSVGVHAIVGVDYLINRKMLVGLDVRAGWLPLTWLDPSAGQALIQATLRFSYLIEI